MKDLYLITGGFGYLGNTIIQKLLEDGKKVRVLVLPSDKINIEFSNDIEIIKGDVCDKLSLNKFFKDTDKYNTYVIHCAGIVTIASKYDSKVYDVNVNGTKNIVDLCLKKHIKKLIYVSSVHAIEEKPNNEIMHEVNNFDKDKVHGLYAKTKAEATQYVLDKVESGLNACIVHPSGICGPYDYGKGHLTQLVIDVYKHKMTAYIDGGYDFVDVRDVSDGIISCIKKGKSGECYILSNKRFDVKELLDIICDEGGHKRIKTKLPMWFAKLTAPLAEIYYKLLKQPPLYTPYSLYTLSCNSNFSHEKADKELNYKTRDMKDTIKDTIKFLKEKGRI